MVNCRGARLPQDAHQPRHRKRWASDLYMDGASLINFTVGAVPQVVEKILTAAELAESDVDLYLLHQATWKMLSLLQQRLGLDDDRLPIRLRDCGNTVSSTLPILINDLRQDGRLTGGRDNLLIGFGVGWSWAGCVWRDVWSAR